MTEKLLRLKQDLGSVKLVPSGGGRFEVKLDGTSIYSKLQTGRFPDPDTVVQAIRAKL